MNSITLVAVPGGTELTFTHTGLAGETSARSHEAGWTGALDKLVRNMDSIDVPADVEQAGEQ